MQITRNDIRTKIENSSLAGIFRNQSIEPDAPQSGYCIFHATEQFWRKYRHNRAWMAASGVFPQKSRSGRWEVRVEYELLDDVSDADVIAFRGEQIPCNQCGILFIQDTPNCDCK